MRKMRVMIGAAFVALLAGGGWAMAQESSGELLKGKQALGDWHLDKPGVRRLITAQDLPPVEESSANRSEIAPMPQGAKPKVPEGFSVELVASGIANPRALRVAPNGDLFLASSRAGEVRVLRVPAGKAEPSVSTVFASHLFQPYGIAFYPLGPDPEWVYVADSDGVVRFPYQKGDLQASGKGEKVIERIPWVHHWTRDIAFTPDGKRLLLSVGSGSNVALDMSPEPLGGGGLKTWAANHSLGATWDTEERRADVLSYAPDGTDEKVYAAGLRNCSGLTIRPETGKPWCVVNERDELGDNTPFEYATEVQEGAFYGWPWYYIGGNQDPRHKGARADLKDKVTVPDVLIQAHSAPLQIAFYEGDQFPPEYKGSAFVALHGSWNRATRTGYKVVRLTFGQDGKPTGEYQDFMTGFVLNEKQVWGRPVGVAVAQDGSLFVTEDGNGTIWRVTHQPVLSGSSAKP